MRQTGSDEAALPSRDARGGEMRGTDIEGAAMEVEGRAKAVQEGTNLDGKMKHES